MPTRTSNSRARRPVRWYPLWMVRKLAAAPVPTWDLVGAGSPARVHRVHEQLMAPRRARWCWGLCTDMRTDIDEYFLCLMCSPMTALFVGASPQMSG